MAYYNNISEWSGSMTQKGYQSGQDAKGAYYMDKLGFKHRWKEGGIGGTSVYSKENDTSPDDISFGEGWRPDTDSFLGYGNLNDHGQTSEIAADDMGDSPVRGSTSGVDPTDRTKALASLGFIASPYNNMLGINSINFTKRGNALGNLLLDLPVEEKSTEDCICVTGLNKEKFKKFFDLKQDYLFDDNNMKSYKETYKTPIDSFLAEFMKLFDDPYRINNCYRKAHYLAQAWWETARWKTLEEYASGEQYDPPGSIAEALGNTQEGDGPLFKGRGCLQLTGRSNYYDYGKFVKEDLIKEPTKVAAKLFLAVNSGGWFWKIGKKLKHGTGDYNEQADLRHTDTISKWINGGSNGMLQRRHKTNDLLKAFHASNCINMKR
jgi:predicted chitinase